MRKINLPDSFEEKLFNFLNSLKKEENSFFYYPMKHGLTEDGKKLNLGFSTYALKIFFMTGMWQKISSEEQERWIESINLFQKNEKSLPDNSYVDETLINFYLKPPMLKTFKDLLKRQISYFSNISYNSMDIQLTNAVRAESKQAISTIYQVGYKNLKPYLDFPKNENEINNFLEFFDWAKPWSAGANFSSLCVFNNTQIDNKEFEKNKEILYKFISQIVDEDTGGYFIGKQPSETELINGAMKVLTGLDWINLPIHYPKKLIDYCLNVSLKNEGCDIVDLVYVLYKCSEQTSYKRNEVIDYLINLDELIFQHYFEEEENAGFSYYLNKSQIYYNGLIISDGKPCPDIHGTLLLCWALSMIDKISESDQLNWKIIKP